MKKIILFFLACFILVNTLPAYAHPPSNIVIAYDPAKKMLHAEIKHQVGNPRQHYIKKADIGLNGKEIASLSFTSQASYFSQLLDYSLAEVEIKKGDKIYVEGYCSISGKLKVEYTVE
ncbi:MAG: hypothetical protein FJZ09_02260 [Candidatus Omnitrophica bacterium]|nr:hypothetical protein [Candidatus Omnitrophota bacterium]